MAKLPRFKKVVLMGEKEILILFALREIIAKEIKGVEPAFHAVEIKKHPRREQYAVTIKADQLLGEPIEFVATVFIHEGPRRWRVSNIHLKWNANFLQNSTSYTFETQKVPEHTFSVPIKNGHEYLPIDDLSEAS